MKAIYLFAVFIFCMLLAQCKTTRNVTYEIPVDYPPARREQVIALFEKGKVLYKNNCAECHGIFTAGKDSIPNFSQVQFDNYSAKFVSGDPMNHAIAKKMSPQQLNEVLTFLKYRKRSG